MKGTLFSADFCYDSNGNPKLLEINTDTSFINSVVDNKVDFSAFKDVLSSNNITTVHVIYKNFHTYFVSKLETYLEANASFITAFSKTEEEPDTVFPTAITDADDKFILRLVYDEAALLDSTYAKSEPKLFKLFSDNTDTDSIVPVYFSGSAGEVNTLTDTFNSGNLPDFVTKAATAGGANGVKFFKLGEPTAAAADRVSNFKTAISSSDTFISNYLPTVTDNRTTSARSFQIVYGSNLDVVYLGQYEVDSFLTLPSSDIVTGSSVVNLISNKHFHEFATNDPKEDQGLQYGSLVLKADRTGVSIGLAETGSDYTSFAISGSPDTDSYVTLGAWSHSGETLPEGSSATTSSLETKHTYLSKGWAVRKLTIEGGDEILLGGNTKLPVYSAASDTIAWKSVRHIDIGDKVYNVNGTGVPVTAHSVVIYDSADEANLTEPNLETVDTYVTKGTDDNQSIIIHNAPCFIAGTKIKTTIDGSEKAIETIEIGSNVVTYNFTTNEDEIKEVLNVTSREVDKTVVYTFSEGHTLEATHDHPVFISGKGWCAYDPALSATLYSLESTIGQIEVGDKAQGVSHSSLEITGIEVKTETVTVYNLSNVADNHNFFAEQALVHNRAVFVCFAKGDKVEMYDGSLKAIDKVIEGDEVKSSKNGKVVKGIVTEALLHPTNDVMQVVKINGITAEANHPILVNGKWVAASTLGEVTTEFIENFYNLEVDGNIEDSEHNYIIGGLVASGLGDNAELNAKYQRQSIELTKHL